MTKLSKMTFFMIKTLYKGNSIFCFHNLSLKLLHIFRIIKDTEDTLHSEHKKDDKNGNIDTIIKYIDEKKSSEHQNDD